MFAFAHFEAGCECAVASVLLAKGKRKGRRLVDEASSDAMPDAAGGEGGHGVAKSYAVIHRRVAPTRSANGTSSIF
jgi:hypothetical protein